MDFIAELVNRFISTPVETWKTLGVFFVSGTAISFIQYGLNHWMQSKRVIHASLVVLSVMVGAFELSAGIADNVLSYQPANAGLIFTSALTFYRFAGKPLFAVLDQQLEDLRVGRDMRVSAPSQLTHAPGSAAERVLPVEDFAM